MFSEEEMCGRAIAIIEPSREAVNAIMQRETMTNQKAAPFWLDSGVETTTSGVFRSASDPSALSVDVVDIAIAIAVRKDSTKKQRLQQIETMAFGP
jgi:hypothetical protein